MIVWEGSKVPRQRFKLKGRRLVNPHHVTMESLRQLIHDQADLAKLDDRWTGMHVLYDPTSVLSEFSAKWERIRMEPGFVDQMVLYRIQEARWYSELSKASAECGDWHSGVFHLRRAAIPLSAMYLLRAERLLSSPRRLISQMATLAEASERQEQYRLYRKIVGFEIIPPDPVYTRNAMEAFPREAFEVCKDALNPFLRVAVGLFGGMATRRFNNLWRPILDHCSVEDALLYYRCYMLPPYLTGALLTTFSGGRALSIDSFQVMDGMQKTSSLGRLREILIDLYGLNNITKTRCKSLEEAFEFYISSFITRGLVFTK